MPSPENKKIKIPGRLVPATTEGVIVGTDVIIDETLEIEGRTGYTQAELNQKFALGETGPIEPERITDGSITPNKIAPNAIVPGKIDVSSLNTEDLNLNSASEVEFANRTYNSTTPNGMGYKIIRQGAGLTFANQVTETNTIYEIRYNFDLGNQTVNVPENATLYFNGGKVSNGTLNGNNGVISSIMPVDRVMEDVTLTGEWEYDQAAQVQSDWNQTDDTAPDYIKNKPEIPLSELDVMFEQDNMLNNPFFRSQSGWTLTNAIIENNKVVVNGGTPNYGDSEIVVGVPSYVSQTIEQEQEQQLLAGHRYLIVCYAKVTKVNHAEKNWCFSFYGRYGIGFRVKDETLIANKGEYTLNLDFVGNREKSDFVPIIHVLDVYNNANPTLSFGQIYPASGTIEGEILHAGLYDISNERGIPDYKKLYLAYRDYIERALQYKSSCRELKYPDSIADLAFIEEMNSKAKYMCMNNTQFGNPSGLLAMRDAYNNNISYMTVLQPDSVEQGKMLSPAGAVLDNSRTNVYTFNNINPKNKYFVKNLYIDVANYVEKCCFYRANGTNGFSYNSYKSMVYKDVFYEEDKLQHVKITKYNRNAFEYTQSNSWAGNNINYDVYMSEMLNVPEGYSMIKLMSDNGTASPFVSYVPQLICISDAPINDSSQPIDLDYTDTQEKYLTFRAKDIVTTAKDICILNGIAIANRKLQEIWNVQTSDFVMYDVGAISSAELTVQMARSRTVFNNKYFTLYGKGGSNRNKQVGTTTKYRDIMFGLCLKDRSNDKWFAISLARFDYLPDYNRITALPSDAELATELQQNEPVLYNSISELQEGEYVTVTNEILETYYPNIHARKKLNEDTGIIYDTLINWYQEKEGYWYKDLYEFSDFDPDTNLDWDVCAICEVYPDMPYVYDEVQSSYQDQEEHRYQTQLVKTYSTVRGKNIDMAIHPMSITKTMTILTALQYINPSDYIEYKEGNRVAGSGTNINNGEFFTFRDAIIAMLYSSDNSIATNICNQAGQKILEARYGK